MYRDFDDKENFDPNDNFPNFIYGSPYAEAPPRSVPNQAPHAICPACGLLMDTGHRICPRCGSSVAGSSPTQPVPPGHYTSPVQPPFHSKICPNCGQYMEASSQFCPNCGMNAAFRPSENIMQTVYGPPPFPFPGRGPGKKKGKARRIIAIILLILQAMSLYGPISDGQLGLIFSHNIPYLIGYFLPTIIAAVLLLSAAKS